MIAGMIPRIRNVRARAVNVPLNRPLQTSGGLVKTAPLVLIDLETDHGLTGHGYVFCYTPIALQSVVCLIEGLTPLITGQDVAPMPLERLLQRQFRLLGPQGLTGMAAAGIDMAAWDALAKSHGVSLVRMLGGVPRAIQAYNSCGLGLIGPERVAAEAEELLAPGFKALKLRLGYPDLSTDIVVLSEVRERIGPDVSLFVDYNQCLSVGEAMSRVRALDEFDLDWIEEPTTGDDYAGHAEIARAAETPIQLGENWWGTHDMMKSVVQNASDYVMPDVMKIGGVTGWMRAAAIAEANGLAMSSHLFPEVSSHLLAVTPTAHWLEYVDFASPVLKDPVRPVDGFVTAPDTPGIGISWNEEAITRLTATAGSTGS
jgi:mandelate racemase